MKQIADRYTNINLHLIQDDGSGGIDLFDFNQTWNGALSHHQMLCCNYTWITKIDQLAEQLGIGSIFSGQFGNQTLSWKGLPPRKLTKRLIQLKSPLRNTIDPSYCRKFFVNPSIIQQYAIRKKKKSAAHSHLASIKQFTKKSLFLHEQNTLVRLHSGTEVLRPLQDEKIIQFALSIPDSYYQKLPNQHLTNSQGEVDKHNQRFVCRNIGNGLLPSAILENSKHGAQGYGAIHKLIEQKERFSELYNDISQVAYLDEIIEPELMKSTYMSMLIPAPNIRNNAFPLLIDGISLAQWLLKHM